MWVRTVLYHKRRMRRVSEIDQLSVDCRSNNGSGAEWAMKHLSFHVWVFVVLCSRQASPAFVNSVVCMWRYECVAQKVCYKNPVCRARWFIRFDDYVTTASRASSTYGYPKLNSLIQHTVPPKRIWKVKTDTSCCEHCVLRQHFRHVDMLLS